jgi:2-phosphosulfolactate phosphatase
MTPSWHLDVAFMPRDAARWTDTTSVLVDVLRASTSITTMLERGCTYVVPVGTEAAARKLARSHGLLLTGEQGGLPPRGFDFGNSPAEFAAHDLSGRAAVMVTSNGTPALRYLSPAPHVLLGCLRNAAAVTSAAWRLAEPGARRLGVVCAGRLQAFALDDALCAGHLVRRWQQRAESEGAECVMSDSARAALLMLDGTDLAASFWESGSGRWVTGIGKEADVRFALTIDASETVPILERENPLPRLVALTK